MNIVAPRPQKASHYQTIMYAAPHTSKPIRHTNSVSYNNNSCNNKDDDEEEACQELRRILASHSYLIGEQLSSITRTNNPLPNDSSFLPTTIKQAVSHHLSNTTNNTSSTIPDANLKSGRQRSFSVNDSRNYPFKSVISLVH